MKVTSEHMYEAPSHVNAQIQTRDQSLETADREAHA